jgi:hypothetical protein
LSIQPTTSTPCFLPSTAYFIVIRNRASTFFPPSCNDPDATCAAIICASVPAFSLIHIFNFSSIELPLFDPIMLVLGMLVANFIYYYGFGAKDLVF